MKPIGKSRKGMEMLFTKEFGSLRKNYYEKITKVYSCYKKIQAVFTIG